jgi:hypothetical protein
LAISVTQAISPQEGQPAQRQHRVILHVSSKALPLATVTGIMPHGMTWKPLHFFAVAIAGWMNRQQQDAISYFNMLEARGEQNGYQTSL